jgi:hypothetical protein
MMKFSIEYRGPSDYDVDFDDELLDALETSDLLTYVGIDMRDKLIDAGWLDHDERYTMQ